MSDRWRDCQQQSTNMKVDNPNQWARQAKGSNGGQKAGEIEIESCKEGSLFCCSNHSIDVQTR